jgi:hypothetical protein
MLNYRKKHIEVTLPLDAINKESAREKSSRHGCLSTFRYIQFDNGSHSCYKFITSPLFLRGQGARRLTTASAFLSLLIFAHLLGEA